MLRYPSYLQREQPRQRPKASLRQNCSARIFPVSTVPSRPRRQPQRASRYRTWSLFTLLQLALVAGWGVAQLVPLSPQLSSLPGQNKNFKALQAEPEMTVEQAQALFADADSVGAIAIGMAEGTRTIEGDRTSTWQGHLDPANEAINQGTFSWQGDAISAEDADYQAIHYIQSTVVPSLLRDGEQQGMVLNPELLIQGVDLWIQSPEAGTAFVSSLRKCKYQHNVKTDIVLCTRVQSYYNSQTGELEASGFNNDLALLAQDQRRRIRKVEQVVAQKL